MVVHNMVSCSSGDQNYNLNGPALKILFSFYNQYKIYSYFLYEIYLTVKSSSE